MSPFHIKAFFCYIWVFTLIIWQLMEYFYETTTSCNKILRISLIFFSLYYLSSFMYISCLSFLAFCLSVCLCVSFCVSVWLLFCLSVLFVFERQISCIYIYIYIWFVNVYILCVQGVWPILCSNLLYKMGHYFLSYIVWILNSNAVSIIHCTSICLSVANAKHVGL